MLLDLIPQHSIVMLTETKEALGSTHDDLPGYVIFNLPAFTPPEQYQTQTNASGGIKVLCKNRIGHHTTLWYTDPDRHYLWLAIHAADGSETTFIGCAYFPPENSDTYVHKSVTKIHMMRPIIGDIQRMLQSGKQAYVIFMGDFNIHLLERQMRLQQGSYNPPDLENLICRCNADKSRMTSRDRNALEVCQIASLIILNSTK